MNDEDSTIIFKAEARDLLETIERGLLDLEHNPDDAAIVAQVFRAMHTLKGSGAMFGFDELADFAHHCETAFDRVRKKEAPASPELICAVLAAIDHLRALAEGETPPEEESRSLLSILDAAINIGSAEKKLPAADLTTWRLTFRFSPDALKNGTRPYGILNELNALGEAVVKADVSDVPPLESLDPTRIYIGWTVDLKTLQPRTSIEEVFEFDRLNMTLDIAHDVPSALEMAAETAKPPKKEIRKDTSAKPDEASETVRIPAAKLDALLDCVGELVIAQSRLKQTASEIENANLDIVSEDIERLASELRESMMTVRMVPLSHLFGRFRRLAHDLARDTGKKIEFETAGESTELDKTVLERLSDPLIHLIRNAADHGIEMPQERVTAGKPETGRIRLVTKQAGAEVVILLEDDGRGIDPKRIRAKAEESGFIERDATVADADLLQIIFRPGFSTAKTITGLSGRGVGMDVVKNAIEALRGSVEIASVEGAGTTVTLRIPLTLAIIDGLMVRLASERYIIPLSAVEECTDLAPQYDMRQDGRCIILLRNEFVPYLKLHELFETGSPPDPNPKVVVVSTTHGRYGLVVDEIVGDHQTVIKPLSCLHSHLGLYSGATILGDGGTALILDVSRIFDTAKNNAERQISQR